MSITAQRKKGLLKLQVCNFGPITEANIELRPLTLFVGQSNTGKSYLAMLIYALHRLFGERDIAYEYFVQNKKEEIKAPRDIQDELQTWSQQVLQPGLETKMENMQLPDRVAALVRPILSPSDEFTTAIEYEIARCFGVSGTEQLLRHPGNKPAEIILQRYVDANESGEDPFAYEFSLSRRGRVQVSSSIPEAKPLYVGEDTSRGRELILRRIRQISRRSRYRGRPRPAVSDIIGELAQMVFSYIIDPAGRSSYYLPASRTGVMHAHRVVVSALVNRAASAGLYREAPISTLSGVFSDFLETLIALGDPYRRKQTDGEEFAARIEQELLKGTILSKQQQGLPYPSFSYCPHGWKTSIPLMISSSMVSELAPVVLFLRHVVRRGNVLIIEEPEAHLHPGKQVELMQLLATAVHAGIRVIMTTHSEWLLEELANLVRASKLSDSDQKSVNGHGKALNAEDVGVWLFKPKQRPKGSEIQEIRLDSDSGLYPADHDDVASELHNRGVAIENKILDNGSVR